MQTDFYGPPIQIGPGDLANPYAARLDRDEVQQEAVAARAAQILADARRVDEITGDLACFQEAEYRAALMDLLRGDASALASLIEARADELAQRELDDEEEASEFDDDEDRPRLA